MDARAVSFLILGCISVSMSGCLAGGTCGYEVVGRVTSPDGALDAVLFQSDCGATVSVGTHVAVVLAHEQLSDDTPSAFGADCDHGAAPAVSWGGPPASIEWRSNRELVVRYHSNARVFHKDRLIDVSTGRMGFYIVKIDYEPVNEVNGPPNYTLHPSSGVRLGADFVRTLARRG